MPRNRRRDVQDEKNRTSHPGRDVPLRYRFGATCPGTLYTDIELIDPDMRDTLRLSL